MLSKDQRRALLYVAARFMMVKIDYSAKRQAARIKRQATS
jgi:hypothetical protein